MSALELIRPVISRHSDRTKVSKPVTVEVCGRHSILDAYKIVRELPLSDEIGDFRQQAKIQTES